MGPTVSVSYTHLDVYKRQELASLHDLLIEMGTLSQQAIESAKDALLEQDVELSLIHIFGR